MVAEVAREAGRTPAQVALAWTLLNPQVVSPILGARTLAQLEDKLGALDEVLTEAQRQRLDAASAVELGFPHDFVLRPSIRQIISGGAEIAPRR